MNALFYLFSTSAILMMLHSMLVYFLWGTPSYLLGIITLITGLAYLRLSGYYHINKYNIMGTALLMLTQFWVARAFSPLLAAPLLPLLVISAMDEVDKQRIFRLWCWTLGIILSISFVAYLLIPTGILPSGGIIIRPGFEDFDYYTYINYHFCLLSVSIYAYRFNSIFCEPGHIAMIAAFTLFLQGYKFRDIKFWLIFIPCIFTFSLAGYILFVAGYILHILQRISFVQFFKRSFPFIIILVSIFAAGKSYNGGANTLNEMILERLTLDDQKGIVGNNRFSENTDQYFLDCIENGSIIMGIGSTKFDEIKDYYGIRGAGYKMFMIPYGVVGCILVFLGYFFFTQAAENRRIPYLLLIIFSLAFLQRAYPFWASWTFIMILSTSFMPEDFYPEETEEDPECPDTEELSLQSIAPQES